MQNKLTFAAAVQQRFWEHVGVAHGRGLWLHFDLWRPRLSPLSAPWPPVHLVVIRTQRLHAQLLQLLAPQRLGLRTLGVVAQVAVARHLQGPDQAVQRTVATPGVVIDTEVGKARQREQDLFGGCFQSVVLEEQGGELGEAAERSVLHHGDVVLLEVQALQLGELGEHVVPQNLRGEMSTVGFCFKKYLQYDVTITSNLYIVYMLLNC